MTKKYIIGIDLGTTNSCVSILEGKQPKVIPSSEGENTTPSVVSYKKEGSIVGTPAKRQAVTNSKNTLYSTKRFIGKSFADCKEDIDAVPYEVINKDGTPVFKILDKEIRPEEVSAKVLEKMKETALNYLGKDAEIAGAVITVPAYFNNTQKQATMDAGKIAGLEVKRIINEPTAAAIAYGLDKGDQNKKVAVFDFGGGTFDISILEIGDGVIEVKSTNGDNHLGGDDVDNVIMSWITNEFRSSSGVDVSKDHMAIQRIKEAAEKAKKELCGSGASGVLSTEIVLPFITVSDAGPQHLNLNLTRTKFEELISPILDRLIEPCKKALKQSGFSKSEIDNVLAVGGSTRIPLVEEKVKEIFGKGLDKSLNPDYAVAEGAAIQGGILSGDITDMALLDILPISFGIETEGGIFAPIIKSGTNIPTSNEQMFTTAMDNQPSVTIRVLQGEGEMARSNQEIGRFDLTDLPPAPRGVPQISVKFAVNSNGVLTCEAKDTKTGVSQSIEIVAKNGLSDEVIEQLKAEADKNRESDAKEKEFLQSKYEAQSLIKQSNESIKNFKDKVTPEVTDKIKEAADALEKILETSTEVSEIKAGMSELQSQIQKIGESVYGKGAGSEGSEETATAGSEGSSSGDVV